MVRINVIDGALYQWDTGRRVEIITGNGGSVDCVHFNNGMVAEVKVEGDVVTAPIPNILLQSAQNITVYAVVVSEDGTRTVHDCTFNVRAKAKPDDYVYTETEVLTITTAVEKALEEAKESGEFDGKDGVDGKDGLDGYTPRKGVDYYTPEEKAELKQEIEAELTGDIEAALDAIIEIQNSLIGGDSV